MSSVPTNPDTFFTVYVPERFAALAQAAPSASSPGSIVFRIAGTPHAWSYRLKAGKLEVERARAADGIVQVLVSAEDFALLVVHAAELLVHASASTEPVAALRALHMDAERAQLLRDLPGALAVSVADGALTRRLWILPGSMAQEPSAPDCEVQCELSELQAIQSGKTNPFELLMNGKIKLIGRAEIALALSGLFA